MVMRVTQLSDVDDRGKVLKLAEKKSSYRQIDGLSDIKNLAADTVGRDVHKKL